MRFCLVDRITDVELGVRISTIKNLTMGEEYLAEHFPTFPVMPGVLMIEAITQSCSWLLRLSDEFRHSIILLQEARNVRFGQFVIPGKQLELTCDLLDDDGRTAGFKAKGVIDGVSSVSAKVVLTRFNLAEKHPSWKREDRRLRSHHIRAFQMITHPELRENIAQQRARKRSAATSATQ